MKYIKNIDKKVLMTLLLSLAILLVVILSTTYGFFFTTISGQSGAISATTATIGNVTFVADQVTPVSTIYPGWNSGNKNVTISQSKSDVNATYTCNLIITNNTIDDMYLKIGSGSATRLARGNNLINLGTGTLNTSNTSDTITYTLNFKETGTNQNAQQGAIFRGYVTCELVGTGSFYSEEYSNAINSQGTLNESQFITKIKQDNSTISTRSTFNTTLVSNTTGTIYTTMADENNDGLSQMVYYYAGNTTNNWVKFGKDSSNNDIYWRIIRSNENGGIRLLYTGTLPSGTALNSGTSTSEAYISLGVFNSNMNNEKYVGYKYQTTTENDTNSTIKNTIDTWYKNNLLTLYGSYLDKQAIYCNDRSESTLDIEASNTYFGATDRLGGYNWTTSAWVRPSVVSPSYGCANLADRFSASSTGGGNGQLLNTDSNKSPIALMSADEVSYAGGLTGVNLASPYAWYYLNNTNTSAVANKWWWTMSPSSYKTSEDSSRVFNVRGSSNPGYLGGVVFYVTYGPGARPVISLKPCYSMTGDGTIASPYIIDTSNTSCNSMYE